ncbi:hypothetical protein C0Q70_10621 [Pomacea canaliculata]|uniref:Uncharacterized protein n=1 Tax=Pomacea canaliculata TaxID=400727 RepID=A0A2T7P3Q3_POMCA|nr:hypothetical protein C0Q70_10621 [Pomacea canaliculata]
MRRGDPSSRTSSFSSHGDNEGPQRAERTHCLPCLSSLWPGARCRQRKSSAERKMDLETGCRAGGCDVRCLTCVPCLGKHQEFSLTSGSNYHVSKYHKEHSPQTNLHTYRSPGLPTPFPPPQNTHTKKPTVCAL